MGTQLDIPSTKVRVGSVPHCSWAVLRVQWDALLGFGNRFRGIWRVAMRAFPRTGCLVLTCLLVVAAAAPAAGIPSKMQFNEVKEVAPGVFFRYSAISATDKNVVFGGSNNIW